MIFIFTFTISDNKFRRLISKSLVFIFEIFQGTAKPPNWDSPVCQLEGGFENVDFIIWMRTAALPNFRKLWRLVDRYFFN